HEWPIQPAHQPVAPAASFGVLDIPAMLAMDPHRDTGGPCRHDRFQRRQVARMHDRRAQRLEQAQELRVIARQVSRTLAQGDVLHVRTGDSLGELAGDVGERHNCVAPALVRKVIDQVDDPVFEPAHAEAEDDVHKQRLRGVHVRCVVQRPLATISASTRARAALIDGIISSANSRKVSTGGWLWSLYGVARMIAAPLSPWLESFCHASIPLARYGLTTSCPAMRNQSHTNSRCP